MVIRFLRYAFAGTYYLAVAVAAIALALTAEIFIPGDAHAGGSKWTGCYVGAGGAYAMADTKTSLGVAGVGDVATVDGLGMQGIGLYGKVGCDVEIVPKVVLGAWGDYDWQKDTDFTVTVLGAPGDVVKASLDSSWAVGGRAGYLVKKDALIYVLAGYTEANLSDISFPAFPGSTPLATPTLKGYVLGGGVDLSLGKGWFGELEGRWANYDRANIDICGGCGASLGLDTDVLSVRAALAYKFNFDKAELPDLPKIK